MGLSSWTKGLMLAIVLRSPVQVAIETQWSTQWLSELEPQWELLDVVVQLPVLATSSVDGQTVCFQHQLIAEE